MPMVNLQIAQRFWHVSEPTTVKTVHWTIFTVIVFLATDRANGVFG